MSFVWDCDSGRYSEDCSAHHVAYHFNRLTINFSLFHRDYWLMIYACTKMADMTGCFVCELEL